MTSAVSAILDFQAGASHLLLMSTKRITLPLIERACPIAGI